MGLVDCPESRCVRCNVLLQYAHHGIVPKWLSDYVNNTLLTIAPTIAAVHALVATGVFCNCTLYQSNTLANVPG